MVNSKQQFATRSPAHNAPGENRTSMRAMHKQKLKDVKAEIEMLTGMLTRTSQRIDEILANGGTLGAHGQMNFLTGAYARIMKDVAIVDYLQSQGVFQKSAAK